MAMSAEDSAHLKQVVRHIAHVKDLGSVLGEKLIDLNQDQLGFQLIAKVQIHDNSKFYGIEWEFLRDSIKDQHPDLFIAALKQHIQTNDHHPEYFANGISDMNDLQLAEMVCDWIARSNEFGTDFFSWVKNQALQKFAFSNKGGVYKKIKFFAELILDKPFGKYKKINI